MKKVFAFLLLGAWSVSFLQAQKVFSIKESVTYGDNSLLPESLSNLNWIPNSHTYYFKESKNERSYWLFRDVDKNRVDSLTLEHINYALKKYNGIHRPTATPIPDFKSVPGIMGWKNKHEFRLMANSIIFLYDYKDKSLNAEHGYEGDLNNLHVHDETGNYAYTQGQNVMVKAPGGAATQISFDTQYGVVNGVAVHRNEFGINDGLFWSPEGRRLAYYRMDESMVTEYPIYDLDQRPATAPPIRYPFAGAASHHVTLWVYDMKKGRSIQVKTEGSAEQYLTNIAFSPDDKYVFIAIVNRDQNHMWMNKYNAESGEFISTLFEEENAKYVEPEHPMIWIDKSHFIWLSERSGFNHFYLYDENGVLKKQLTQGNWMVREFLGTDHKGSQVFFTATKQSPLNSNAYVVEVKSGEMKEIVEENGWHSCEVSSDGKFLLDRYSSAMIPNKQQLINLKEGKAEVLLNAANPLKDYELGSTRIFTLKSEDNSTDLYCRMILPSHFDSTKKYPVLVYVYGGPHVQLVRNNWLSGANLWMHYMAQQGYVVFTMDSRGSFGRGLEFENATFRQLGTVEMSDQLVGANWLKSQKFVDGNNMAVHGWSFGGFMTTTLMTRAAGTFKVGVAGGPVIDWSMYEVMYTERYMDKPDENPEGYKTANLLNYVQNLDGKLLMIHGTSDPVVLWQHSLLYVRKAVEQEVLMDYFVYPGHEHNVRGKDRVHLMRKITQYIEDNIDK
ncbi:MAG: prolyl oligopeptidase family serine peptidase [Bacteroidetes bacterium]|nr:prolyl oligopeptidase family serine peptidase [Bacteroidota bacterium]